MSTAVGHGLADPKTRGKPVSHANEGRRPPWGGSGGAFGQPRVSLGLFQGGLNTRRTRAERDSGQYSGARRVDRVLLPSFDGGGGRLGNWAPSSVVGRWVKWHSIGGNAKPTFGILSAIPGRDLFSF